MKKFILSSILFLLIACPAITIIPTFLILTDSYKHTVAGNEIYYSIFKSKQKKKTKKIIIGDSVGRQLFSNTTYNDSLNSLACNRGISMAGHFILLNNYLNAGNKIDTVFLIFTPFSFQSNLNDVFTYHYFLKPFYVKEYKPLFTKLVTKQIDKIPYAEFCRFPNILTSNWAPDFKSTDKTDYTFLSPVSVEYLIKIKELSMKHHFKVIILPTPTRISRKAEVERMMKNEITKNNLGPEFKNYFENIIYLNDNNFVDDVHLKREKLAYYTRYYKDKLMK
jgi:hypothetical protein